MTDEILQQLKNPPQFFAVCASRPACVKRSECLRALAWHHNENPTVTALKLDTCHYAPLRTKTIVRGIPKLDRALTHSDYRSFRHEILAKLPRVMLYRIEKCQTWASDDYRRHIERTWGRYSQEPFPWLEVREVVDYDSARRIP